MKILEYLKNKLSILAKEFPEVTIKYCYDHGILRHIVELTPIESYYHDSKLDNAWIPISLEFMATFPEENISFISSDSTLSIESPTLIFNEKNEEIVHLHTIYDELLNTFIDVGFMNFEHNDFISSHVIYKRNSVVTFPSVSNPNNTSFPLSIDSKDNIFFCEDQLPQAA